MNRSPASIMLPQIQQGADRNAPFGRCGDASFHIERTGCREAIDVERAHTLIRADDPPTCWYYPDCTPTSSLRH